MNREEDPELWDLLGRSEAPTPSPFFARNVVRVVRTDSARGRLVSWLNARRLIPALSAATAVAVAAFSFQVLHHHRSPQAGFVSIEPQDAEFVADVDVLASNDDESDDTPLL
jgi:hypothetical protein